MNTTNKLIGKKVKGFKFEKEDGRIYYSHYMNDKIGSIGIITEYDKEYNTYKVAFENDFWAYPAELIEQHLVEETPLDDLPIIGEGVLMEVSGNGENWFQYNVIGKNKHGFFIAWDTENFSTNSWKHARPIPKTKITRKEFEQKFEIID
jgi:hypothetical protein